MLIKQQAEILVFVSLLAAIGLAIYFSYQKGWHHASTLHNLQAEQRESELLKKITSAQQAVLDAEREHAAAIETVRTVYEQQAKDAAVVNAAVIADLRSAQQRVRIPVTSCRTESVPQPGAATGSADGAGTAELDPATAARIWVIAADGERAVRKLTALQDWAREAVRLCSDNKVALLEVGQYGEK